MDSLLLMQVKSPKLFSSHSNLVFTSHTTKIISLTIQYGIHNGNLRCPCCPSREALQSLNLAFKLCGERGITFGDPVAGILQQTIQARMLSMLFCFHISSS